MFDDDEKKTKVRVLKKITPTRLKNIALYYLKRFETTSAGLRQVLRKRINDYAYQNKEFDLSEAYGWADEIISDFERYGCVNDERFAEMKIRDYAAAGKSMRYIRGKLREKGVSEEVVSRLREAQAYDEEEAALKLARKKRIGRFRNEGQRAEYRQKDMAALARAGFSYDIAQKICADDEF